MDDLKRRCQLIGHLWVFKGAYTECDLCGDKKL